MRTLIIIGLIILGLGGALWYLAANQSPTTVGGERDARGCLVAAGYQFDESIGACVRGFELSEATRPAATVAASAYAGSYALTITSVAAGPCDDCYIVNLEYGAERVRQTVRVQGGVTVSAFQTAPTPGGEEAERTAYGFIQDYLALAASPSTSTAATGTADRVLDALSSRARASVARPTLVEDLARFIGVTGAPEQGASVEDLAIADETATLTVGLNYRSGRTLRDVHLVVEAGEWKVDAVTESMREEATATSGASIP